MKRYYIWTELLVFLIITNYMFVTIIFHDNTILKYLRDIIVLLGIFISLRKNYMCFKISKRAYPLFLFVALLIIALFRATSLTFGFTYFRRYLFPILVALFMSNTACKWSQKDLNKFCNFIVVFFTIFSLWGIIQALVLGDTFLMKIGYPKTYMIAYDAVKLGHSFYFGGLGIQRVVSTLSNANNCAFVLGLTIMFLIAFYNNVTIKRKKICISIICLAYILTISRSNFLAMGITVIVFLYPFIPHKKYLFGVVITGLIGCVVAYYSQGPNGFISQIVNWIINSFNFTESSAAGRSDIWSAALDIVSKNPLGLGFGTVGAIARDSSESIFYASENSYLAMAIDMGVLGPILYCVYWISSFSYLKNAGQKASGRLSVAKYKAGCAMIIYLMVAMFFSNYIYGIEIISMLYIYLAIIFSYRFISMGEINAR